MNHHYITCFSMFRRVKEFGEVNSADIAGTTPGTQPSKAPVLFTELDTVITGIGSAATGQMDGVGAAQSGTTLKEGQRNQLEEMMRGIHLSADAIASAQDKPEIMDTFRLNHGRNDTKLVINAKAFADAAEPLKPAFVELGHDVNFIQNLKDQVDAFEKADDSQSDGEQKRSGATQSIAPLIHQGLVIVKQLNAIMHNKYKGNAAKMGAWTTASHIERTHTTPKTPAPAPTPPAPPK